MGWLSAVLGVLAGNSPPRLSKAEQPDVSEQFASESLARAIDWVKFADAKAGTVVVLVGLLLTDALSRAGDLAYAWEKGSGQGDWATVFFVLALATAAAAILAVTLVLYPRVKPETSSIAFFGSVAALSSREYLRELKRLTTSSARTEIGKQSWEVSRIAATKFRRLRWAYGLAVAFLIFYSVSRLLLVWQGSGG